VDRREAVELIEAIVEDPALGLRGVRVPKAQRA
jgi:hypothetical protein